MNDGPPPRNGRGHMAGREDHRPGSRSSTSSPEKPIFLTEPDEKLGSNGNLFGSNGHGAGEVGGGGGGGPTGDSGVDLWLPCSARSPEKENRRQKYTNVGEAAVTPSAKAGSERSGGVLTSLSALKRRQESRRANSASAVMQSPGDFSRYSRDDMGVVQDYSVRGVTTDSTLRSVTSDATGLTKLKLPSRMFGPTSSRVRDEGGGGGGGGGGGEGRDGESPHTFARGGSARLSHSSGMLARWIPRLAGRRATWPSPPGCRNAAGDSVALAASLRWVSLSSLPQRTSSHARLHPRW